MNKYCVNSEKKGDNSYYGFGMYGRTRLQRVLKVRETWTQQDKKLLTAYTLKQESDMMEVVSQEEKYSGYCVQNEPNERCQHQGARKDEATPGSQSWIWKSENIGRRG